MWAPLRGSGCDASDQMFAEGSSLKSQPFSGDLRRFLVCSEGRRISALPTLPDVSRKWEPENGSRGPRSGAGSSAGSVWGGSGVTPVLSRVLNPSDVFFGKRQVPVSGLVQE